MYCILHISDLHRSAVEPLSNAELISALVSDLEHYAREDPPVAAPQAIVVSGDIIQGVKLGEVDYDAKLRDQYDVAYEFLVELTERLLDGDRSKVIIVPGNHDIDWNVARSAMSPAAAPFPKLPQALYEPNSKYRWDWREQQLYFIHDEAIYHRRFSAFWDFFARFYNGISGLLRVEPWSDANLYSLAGGQIGIAAFNSCAGNDCFAFHGEISTEAIGRAALDLRERGPWMLRMAVWHHNIEGPPHRTDYMNPDIVRGMIGRGFRLGLFGHQHYTQLAPQHAYLPDQETMAVVSAGSLCAGAAELPMGARRGYSLVEIADDFKTARVHVREMAYANFFSRATLPIFGGRSFSDLTWTQPVDAGGRPEDPRRETRVAQLSNAEMALFGNNDPTGALSILLGLNAVEDALWRKLTLEAARRLENWSVVIDITGKPQSIEELVAGTEAKKMAGEYEAALQYLSEFSANLGLPNSILEPLAAEIEYLKQKKA